METITINNQIFSKGQIAVEAFNKMEKLLSGLLIRKGYTKTHTVKIGNKQFITFEAYRSLLIGKKDVTLWGKNDIILDVKKIDYTIQYTVQRGDKIVNHNTFIHLNHVV